MLTTKCGAKGFSIGGSTGVVSPLCELADVQTATRTREFVARLLYLEARLQSFLHSHSDAGSVPLKID